MRRSAFVFALSLAMLCPLSTRAAKEQWFSIRSKSFLLVSNAGEKDVRRIGAKLEQFRMLFGRLFPKAQLKSTIPLRVIVFKTRTDFAPFMPAYQGGVSEVAGYFQPGLDVHHIALPADLAGESGYRTVFHEYVHSLLNDNMRTPPLWFNEGLAEFYGTYESLANGQKAIVGKPIASHLQRLRESQFIPLAQLFAVTQGSADYNEREKKSMFYAESWALVHYLMLGNQSLRQPQLINFLSLLINGTNIGETFQQAFQTDFATMEKELRDYISRGNFPIKEYTGGEKFDADNSLTVEPLDEANWQFYLGDLALHMQDKSPEPYLEKAIALDSNLAGAHGALGIARLRAGKLAEAKRHLQNALALNKPNYLVSYYYAQMLFEEAAGPTQKVSDLPANTANTIIGHLKRSIALEPTFSEAYRLLAFTYLTLNLNLDEAANLLQRAIQLNPGRSELGYTLGQVYLRQERYDEARKTLEPIAAFAPEGTMREQAATLLANVKRVADQNTRYAVKPSANTNTTPKSEKTYTPRPAMRKQFDGEKATGLLTEMDCEKGLRVTIKGAKDTWQFHAINPDRVQFVTLEQDANLPITCGKFAQPLRVIVTYRYNTDAKAGSDGELIAIEFVKQ